MPGGNPLLSGTILQQSSNRSFTVANLNGPGVFEVTGLDPTDPRLRAKWEYSMLAVEMGNSISPQTRILAVR